MKALLQRVLSAEVTSEGKRYQSIGYGMLIFAGIAADDTEVIVDKMTEKILHLRMFDGAASKFDKSLIEIEGEALIISQFTLFADTAHGRRPSFRKAARPEQAKILFEYFCKKMAQGSPKQVKHGVFGDRMIVDAKNLGPFSILIEIT